MNPFSNKILPILLALLALIAGVYLSSTLQKATPVATPEINGLLWPNPKQVTSFDLIDQQAKTFDLDSLKGHWSLLFFGYTHCPDICPTTMSLLNGVSTDLEKQQAPIPQIIFVTIDPQRDTQEHLAEYIAYFNPNFIGLTGSEENIAAFTKQLGVLAIKVEDKSTSQPDDYLMDHSSSILLIDPEARLVGIFSAPHNRADITKHYLAIHKFIESQK